MKRRWIIRSFFIGLLLLCVGGWGWSLSHVQTNWVGQHQGFWHCSNGWTLYVVWEERKPAMPARFVWDGLEHVGAHFAGFAAGHSRTSYTENDLTMRAPPVYVEYVLFIGLPFWFPTIMSAGLLWLVWRKTWPKPDPRTAFPVEVKQSNAKEEKTP